MGFGVKLTYEKKYEEKIKSIRDYIESSKINLSGIDITIDTELEFMELWIRAGYDTNSYYILVEVFKEIAFKFGKKIEFKEFKKPRPFIIWEEAISIILEYKEYKEMEDTLYMEKTSILEKKPELSNLIDSALTEYPVNPSLLLTSEPKDTSFLGKRSAKEKKKSIVQEFKNEINK